MLQLRDGNSPANVIRREDYAAPAYWIDTVNLSIDLDPTKTRVLNRMSLRRNAALKPASTLQSATGIKAKKLVQKSMGMSAGSFNTREFFHGASLAVVRNMRWAFSMGLFVLPLVLAWWAFSSATLWPWVLASVLQAPSLIAERWVFFAQAKHPQNLYYQTVG